MPRKTRSKTNSKQKTRKVNSFMKKMIKARKNKAPSFKYKNKVYTRHNKGPLVFYK